jgi:hypothetical protein|tara:strand:+ start:3029 stop:3223 length:195 start_codon:yes stop_codon:yes gene_type:complete
MENVEKTMSVFGGMDRTAYRPNEVKTLLELRDGLHKKEWETSQVIIGLLTVVIAFLSFAVAMLW